MAQLTGEAVRALDEQAQGHAHATEELRREAIVLKTEAANYVSNQHAAEAQAKATSDEMKRIYASEEDEHHVFLLAFQDAQATIAQHDADHLTHLAQAYATANNYAAVQAQARAAGNQPSGQPRLSPPRSHHTSNAVDTLRYDLSPRRSSEPTIASNTRPTVASASSVNLPAKAGRGSRYDQFACEGRMLGTTDSCPNNGSWVSVSRKHMVKNTVATAAPHFGCILFADNYGATRSCASAATTTATQRTRPTAE